MTWTVESATTYDAWFRQALDTALTQSTKPLPPSHFTIGSSDVEWLQNEPGVATVFAYGGTVEDRYVAREVARARLSTHGYRLAQYTFDEGLVKEASWDDIMSKAKRLIQSQQVNLLRNSSNIIVGDVQGDHGRYQTEIARDDPNSNVITQWTCECPWDQFAFQRTRQWKKYEGRPCAHVLATFWKSQGTPVDDQISPQNQNPGQMNLPGMGPGLAPVGPNHYFDPSAGQPMMSPAQQLPMPGAQQQPPQPPEQPSAIPPFPLDQMQPPVPPPPPTVSVPGAKPPTPANPVQYPGGTFSSWKFAADEFKPGTAVQFLKPEMGQAIGKSEEHGAGQWTEIPRGAVAEFVYQDPTTGLCEVRWPLHTSGPMEPFHVQCAVDPSFIKARPDLPNPFEKTWPRQ